MVRLSGGNGTCSAMPEGIAARVAFLDSVKPLDWCFTIVTLSSCSPERAGMFGKSSDCDESFALRPFCREERVEK